MATTTTPRPIKMDAVTTRVFNLIPNDPDERITSKSIFLITGINPAEVRACVNKLRCLGVKVCSDSDGYYISEAKCDVDRTIAHLKSRCNKIEEAIIGMTR